MAKKKKEKETKEHGYLQDRQNTVNVVSRKRTMIISNLKTFYPSE